MNKTILKGLAAVTPQRIRPRVIYYHSVHPHDANSLHPETFKRHLQWLVEHGYAVLSFSNLMDAFYAGKLSPHSVSVTFDDGYIDNYEYALPILLDRRIAATFFVVSGLVGNAAASSNLGNKLFRDKLMLNKGMLREMHSYGMEIGSHSKSHVNIRQAAEACNDRAFQEVSESKHELEGILGEKITAFAYPNGQRGVFSAKTLTLLESAGFRYGATTIWGSVGASVHPMEVPRMEIRNDDDMQVFADKMKGKYDYKSLVHNVLDNTSRW